MDELTISIIIPVFNDWESLEILITNINDLLLSKVKAVNIFAVNDNSTQPFPRLNFSQFTNLMVVHLTRNLENQKAVAIGLSYIAQEQNCDILVVMDGDGEDKPEDIEKLVVASISNKSKVIFAQRKKRKDSIQFKLLYFSYKVAFKILTGKQIAFGNFCAIPNELIKKIANISEIWNHFSGGVIHSKIPFSMIPLNKGIRYAGKSKMNIVKLIMHGLSSFTVHLEVVSVRLLLFSVFLIAVSILGALVVLYFRLFTDSTIPGWASDSLLGFTTIIIQTFFMCLLLTFLVLFYRTQKVFIPAKDYKDYILNIDDCSQK